MFGKVLGWGYFTLFILLISNCSRNTNTHSMHKNELASQTSLYLLQHANNPVHWKAWSKEAFEQAREEGKLVVISIGYSACHWCHVMEHESFEDSAVAEIMNEHFVSIKVDREEHPDVDQIYMTAVQLMTGQGGWPLNVVALPDGRPIWGATYLPKENWMQSLKTLHEIYREDPDKVLSYAAKLKQGIVSAELIEPSQEQRTYDQSDLQLLLKKWSENFDSINGGISGAPKFPMPDNWRFLLDYAHLEKDEESLKQLHNTLKNMAFGGIYDQLQGGFSRYSVDDEWKVPHFEKMLYDNAQLIELYSRAWMATKEPLYKEVVQASIEWLSTNMLGEQGQFYSAMDADSEGEEGKYYIWPEVELKEIIGEDEWPGFTSYFDLKKGKWEGRIILLRQPNKGSVDDAVVRNWKSKLLKQRGKRVPPATDDKSLTSWNAMAISALIHAYKAFGESEYLNLAIHNAKWISKYQLKDDNSLWHTYKNERSHIEGLIEDYAFAIEAWINLYEVTGDESFYRQAMEWVNFCNENFRDPATALYFTRNTKKAQLIARSMEVQDNVIPAANSVMAHNLLKLYHFSGKKSLYETVLKMISQLDKERVLNYGGGYSNWARLLLYNLNEPYEVAIVGKDAEKYWHKCQDYYLPELSLCWSKSSSELPLIKGRYVEGQTLFYLCRQHTCLRPLDDFDEALALLRQ